MAFVGCLSGTVKDFSVGVVRVVILGQEVEWCSVCLRILNMVLGLCAVSKMSSVTSVFWKEDAT